MADATTNLLDLSGQVAIVTGSGRGIGYGIANRLLEAGATVMLTGRSAQPAFHLSASQADRSRYYAGDLAEDGAADRLIKATADAFGRVDILVNNAGIQGGKPLLDITAEGWDVMIAANLRSVFLCIQAAARTMRAQGSGGAIVNIASVRAARPGSGMAHYSASKAAVVALTRTAAAEFGPYTNRQRW